MMTPAARAAILEDPEARLRVTGSPGLSVSAGLMESAEVN